MLTVCLVDCVSSFGLGRYRGKYAVYSYNNRLKMRVFRVHLGTFVNVVTVNLYE